MWYLWVCLGVFLFCFAMFDTVEPDQIAENVIVSIIGAILWPFVLIYLIWVIIWG